MALLPGWQEVGLGYGERIRAGKENNALKYFSVRELMHVHTWVIKGELYQSY